MKMKRNYMKKQPVKWSFMQNAESDNKDTAKALFERREQNAKRNEMGMQIEDIKDSLAEIAEIKEIHDKEKRYAINQNKKGDKKVWQTRK